jgi:adenine-specific DNA-methyltransferase
MAAMAADELVFTPSKGSYSVNYKQYLRDAEGDERPSKPKSIIQEQFTKHGTYESMALFGLEQKFAFPKPEGLIERVLEAATNPNDLILDSFLGSGTTAAVATQLGHAYLGIDIAPEYLKIARERLNK